MKILTFDIEEWFHILDNNSTKTEREWGNYESRIHASMDKIFTLLQTTGQQATFFCLGWIARKYPEIIRKIDSLGYEIASHSDLHQLAYTQDKKEFERDLERSIQSLEDIIGKKVKGYRAPGFSFKSSNRWTFEILMKYGIETDCSIFPAKRAHGGFPEFGKSQPCWIEIDGMRMKEFPINLKYIGGYPLIFSGGGYFRLMPAGVLKRLFNSSNYTMTYFHPRDFDPGQPIVPGLGSIRRFKSYYGLAGCYEKLHTLLAGDHFMDLRTAGNIVDWETAEVIKLS